MKENFTKNLPAPFVRNVIGASGEKGAQWLDDLPRIVDEIAEKWSLDVKRHFPNISYNYVAPCNLFHGGSAVLKIGLPEEKPEISYEAEFLRICDGSAAVRLLNFDEKQRAMLIEKLSPGKNLKQIFRADKEKAIEAAIEVMLKIRRPADENFDFRHLRDWFGNFKKAVKTDFPLKSIKKAEEFYEQLSSDSKQKYVLHGDLHHENILSAERQPFLAIDPKGIVGEIGYETAVFLNNHIWWIALGESDLKQKLNFAVHQFSEAFEIEERDVRKWASAQMILSAWWTFEEFGENWKRDLELAEVWGV
jgi:streptomycin 6-kinase